MARKDRREAARARLAARFGRGRDDAELVGEALSAVSSAVTARGALSEEDAYAEVQGESERMRSERRSGVSARR